MLKKVSLSGQNLSLSDINDYYVDNQRALKVYFSSHSFNFDSRFANYTINEIETELQARLDELDKLVSFSILSALEASFRIDYLRRCDQKRKIVYPEK